MFDIDYQGSSAAAEAAGVLQRDAESEQCLMKQCNKGLIVNTETIKSISQQPLQEEVQLNLSLPIPSLWGDWSQSITLLIFLWTEL